MAMRSTKILLWQSASILVLIGLAAAAAVAEPVAERQQSLRYLVLQDCGSCHGMTLKGGLGKGLLPHDLEGAEVSSLADIILKGVPGTPMPGWQGLLSKEEAMWIARNLKEGKIAQ